MPKYLQSANLLIQRNSVQKLVRGLLLDFKPGVRLELDGIARTASEAHLRGGPELSHELNHTRLIGKVAKHLD